MEIQDIGDCFHSCYKTAFYMQFSVSARTASPSIKHANKEPGQYPAILTSHLLNKPYTVKPKCDKGPRD